MHDVMWWLTVAGYWITAVLCILCGLKQKTNKGQRNTWWGLAASMLILGINKQQNLTGILTRQVRRNAGLEGWYSSRADLQLLVVGAFLVLGLVLIVGLIRYRHTVSRLQWIAILGVIFLFCFALIRAVSLHAIDIFLYANIAGIQPNWLVEWGGIALVAIPTILTLMRIPIAQTNGKLPT